VIHPERNHINVLGEDGMYYSDYQELYDILNNLIVFSDINCYHDYTPEKVMAKFKEVFLDA
jgi:hypothetical protein